MATLVLMDIDGTVCPQGQRSRHELRTMSFRSPIGDVWAYRSVVEGIRDLPAEKVWLTAWEELAGETFGRDFGFHEHLVELSYDPDKSWTDWWKADAVIDRVTPHAGRGIDQVIWCDDELSEGQNRAAIQRVSTHLQSHDVALQMFAPDPGSGLNAWDLGLIRNLLERSNLPRGQRS